MADHKTEIDMFINQSNQEQAKLRENLNSKDGEHKKDLLEQQGKLQEKLEAIMEK